LKARRSCEFTDGRSFRTYAPSDPTLVQRLYNEGVTITARPGQEVPPWAAPLLLWSLPFLVIIGILLMLPRRIVRAPREQQLLEHEDSDLPAVPERPAAYVGVLQPDGVPPGFVLSLDPDRGRLVVRMVGAEEQPGKSYELWMVSDRLSGPQPLGIIGKDGLAFQPQPGDYEATILNSATYSVSLEPEGGSPSGVPTGPMVYSGKLIQVTPVGFRDQTP
jgi:hypothetical protein